MRRILGIGLTGVGLAALVLAGTPATAATLPATDDIFILPCDNDEYDGLLYKVDPATGQTTRVGTWENPDTEAIGCAGPGSYNPVDGKGYWISWDTPANLIQVDLATGVNTVVGGFTLEGEPYYTPIALAIDGAGNAWGTSWESTPDVLFSVNLATAELTVVGPTGVADESENYGLAWDQVTGGVYAYNTGTNDFYTVDTATGAFTVFNDDVLASIEPYAIAFDSAGQVWGIDGDIISAPLSDLDNSEILAVFNPHPESEGDIYSESIIIAPKPAPALAATGADRSDTALVAGAGFLLLVAGVLVARRRRSA